MSAGGGEGRALCLVVGRGKDPEALGRQVGVASAEPHVWVVDSLSPSSSSKLNFNVLESVKYGRAGPQFPISNLKSPNPSKQ